MIFMERLDKILSNLGGMTRSEARTQIKCGHVTVNGIIVKDFGFKINDSDEVISNGAKINTAKFRYFMLNKPAGVVSATKDSLSETVLSLLPKDHRTDLFPVFLFGPFSNRLFLLRFFSARVKIYYNSFTCARVIIFP